MQKSAIKKAWYDAGTGKTKDLLGQGKLPPVGD